MSYETEVAALTAAVNTVTSLVTTLDTTTKSAYNVAVATAQTHAGTALTQANIAATQVALATTQKSLAITQATNAATSATTATTQAGIATTQAAAATAAAVGASNIVLGVSTLYPAIRPSLSLDFASGQVVDPRITFTRASTATRTNSRGLIELLPSGVPRIDFDPVTLACKGLLVEEQRTNLLLRSEEFDNASWIKAATTITANAIASPDGATTTDKLIASAASAYHYAGQSCTVLSNTVVTLSIYAKAGEYGYIHLQATPDGTNYIFCGFDLTAGTAGTPVNAGNGSGAYGTITPVGGGWYRCTLTGIPSSTVANPLCAVYVHNASTTYSLCTGNGTSGLYIWGAQLEAGAFPTSYIPTVASQVTRAADVASMTGANFSSWYRADEGSFVVSADTLTNNSLKNTVYLDNPASGYMSIKAGRPSGFTGFTVLDDAAALSADLSGSAYSANGVMTLALAYKANDFALSDRGGVVATDTSGSLPVGISAMGLGSDLVGNYQNGHIRSLSYYPKRLTNAELQALSTQ